jgi:hypothetical protein
MLSPHHLENQPMQTERYGATDAEGFRSALLFENTRVENLAAFAMSATFARKLYTGFGKPPPPMPDSLSFPCSMRITERDKLSTGEQIGRVQFVHLDNETVLFDQVWTVSEPRIP